MQGGPISFCIICNNDKNANNKFIYRKYIAYYREKEYNLLCVLLEKVSKITLRTVGY